MHKIFQQKKQKKVMDLLTSEIIRLNHQIEEKQQLIWDLNDELEELLMYNKMKCNLLKKIEASIDGENEV